jgi:hypothetical protein
MIMAQLTMNIGGDVRLDFNKNSSKTIGTGTQKIEYSPKISVVSFIDNSIFIDKGNMFGTVWIPENFIITFTIVPLSKSEAYANVFHFTVNSENSFRMPAVYFDIQSTTLVFEVGTRQGVKKAKTRELPLNSQTLVIMEAIDDQFTVKLNGSIEMSVQAPNRTIGSSVLYFSNPWEPSASAMLGDFLLVNTTETVDVSEFSTVTKILHQVEELIE